YQSNTGPEHWSAVEHVLKYLRRTKEYMLIYQADELLPLGYTDSDFQAVRDESKSTSGFVFTLGGRAIVRRSVKQKCVADSTMEAEYVASSEAAKEAVWLKNFHLDLDVVPSLPVAITLFFDNSGAVANSKEPRTNKASKHIECKHRLIREIFRLGEVVVAKIQSEDNLAYPFTKSLPAKVFTRHVEEMGCVDTGATDHVCNSMQRFQEIERLREGEVTIYFGDASRASTVAVGDVYLDFGLDRFLVLKDCLYAPSFRKNLISVSKLFMNSFSATFDNKVVICFGKKFICSGSL
ncbi:cysteine-rich RLK (RECEPTOR-like protein kinase) 8, partial [Striga hermonthica]